MPLGNRDQGLRIDTVWEGRKRAITGVLGSVIMFTMVFTIGVGFFIFTNQTALQNYQANSTREAGIHQALGEQLSLLTGTNGSRNLVLEVNNTGSVAATIVDVFVTNSSGMMVSRSHVTPNGGFLAGSPDINLSLPLALQPGSSTSKLGYDIAVSLGSFNLTSYPPDARFVASVLTSSGLVFSAPYPPVETSVVATSTSTSTSWSNITITEGNRGGNVLVVQMKATPPQTFSCSSCINDTVTVYNYGPNQTIGVTLTPDPPFNETTGTLFVDSNGPCMNLNGTTKISGYSGSGVPPHLIYLCNYRADTNGFGGFVSFTGAVAGTYNSEPVTSGEALSNTIQVGGPLPILNQGPFTANFFFMKYSACVSMPSTGHPCKTVPSPMSFGNLTNADQIQGHTSYYVAFYAQITNNYNTSIAILPYTYFQTDATVGYDSAFFLVGNSSLPNYVPDYTGTSGSGNVPTLVPYPSTCIAANTSACIQVLPGHTVTLTFAACDIGLTWWDWAGSRDGAKFDAGGQARCTTQPPDFSSNIATYGSVVVTFTMLTGNYKGQVYAQNIPFMGMEVN